MKTILLTLLTFASVGSLMSAEQSIQKVTFGAKLNPYRAYPESKQFSFFTDITIDKSTNTAEVILTSYEDMGITPCDFKDEVLDQITRHVALWLKNNTSVKNFSLMKIHPKKGISHIVKEVNVDAFALKAYCWQAIYCVEYKA